MKTRIKKILKNKLRINSKLRKMAIQNKHFSDLSRKKQVPWKEKTNSYAGNKFLPVEKLGSQIKIAEVLSPVISIKQATLGSFQTSF